MNTNYSNEKNVQILIALMKAHGVRKIVASPGTTNIALVASLQQDDFFEIYSSVDERSAAYMACGLAAETGEAVALSCTGATASRNYVSGLTEAYYRSLPVLAITSTQHIGRVGHHIPQVIDRSIQIKDTVKLSIQLNSINTTEDEWVATTQINKALLELNHRNSGPVHINLTTTYSTDFSVKELPEVRVIKRISEKKEFPEIKNGKIAIFVGSHGKFEEELVGKIEEFCEKYNAIVLCDHSSNYKGKYRILGSIACSQNYTDFKGNELDLLIHIGDVSGSYMNISSKETWRVNIDGELRDTFNSLKYIFETTENNFFEIYNTFSNEKDNNMRFFDIWSTEVEKVTNKIPELPFSNIWIAKNTVKLFPSNSVLHLGILNTLRSWNFFEVHNSILSYSNTGGFGIDGCVSSLIGASIANKDKLYFGIVGDLAFFYDMNSIGNRFVGNNIRLMIINNGKGIEFRNYNHKAARFGEEADLYMAAGGHYGNKSEMLIKNYSENLGYKYLSAKNKKEYMENVEEFISENNMEKSIIFEVFTDSQDESDALEIINNIETTFGGGAKGIAKKILGQKGKNAVKKILGK